MALFLSLSKSYENAVTLIFSNVVDREGQSTGFWAWDVVDQQMVLIIPVILAILGDNPMQSELACHVGLAGKLFCRCCFVHGRDSSESKLPVRSQTSSLLQQDHTSDSDSVASLHLSESQEHGRKGKTRKQETMEQLLARTHRFLGVSSAILYTPFIEMVN